jgi:type II secretory pathway component PulF
MPRFRYRALRQTGSEVEGELVAEDARAAAMHLQAIGSFPIEIAPTAKAPRRSLGRGFNRAGRRTRVGARDLASSRASSRRSPAPALRSTGRWC